MQKALKKNENILKLLIRFNARCFIKVDDSDVALERLIQKVLSKKGPEMSYSTGGGTAPSPTGGAPVMTPGVRRTYRPESFYLLTAKGKMEMFNTFYDKPKPLISLKTQKLPSGNMVLLERAMEPYFQEIQSYAAKHKLSFDDKDDFLEILDYYKTLAE